MTICDATRSMDAQAPDESSTVRVLSNELVAVPNDAVYGAHDSCGVARSIKMLDDFDFVRNGANKPRPSHCPGSSHRVSKQRKGYFAINAAPVKAMMPIGRFDLGNGRIFCAGHRNS